MYGIVGFLMESIGIAMMVSSFIISIAMIILIVEVIKFFKLKNKKQNLEIKELETK